MFHTKAAEFVQWPAPGPAEQAAPVSKVQPARTDGDLSVTGDGEQSLEQDKTA